MLSDKKIAYDHFLIISEPPHRSQHKDPIVRRYSVLILVAFQLNTNVTSAFLHVPSTPPLHNHKLYQKQNATVSTNGETPHPQTVLYSTERDAPPHPPTVALNVSVGLGSTAGLHPNAHFLSV